MKKFFYRVFYGFVIGTALIAPGVSGSVMAIMMGIYEDLLDIMANPFKNLKRNLGWVIPMGIGAAVSALVFVIIFSSLFDSYPLASALLLIGLIAGNLPAVFRDAKGNGFKASYAVPMAVGFLLSFGFGALRAWLDSRGPEASSAPDALWYMAVCGVTAGIIAIVPGMSISTTLLLFGVYERLLAAARGSIDEALAFVGLSDKAEGFSSIFLMAVTGTCFIAGMIAFSRVIKHILANHKAPAYWTVFSFMCGSVGAIILTLPFDDANFALWQGLLALLLGVGISLLFVVLSKRVRIEE